MTTSPVNERVPPRAARVSARLRPTVAALADTLGRHVIEAWFPRCLDLERGGFLCDFDRTWTAGHPQDKLLEFQARQTLFAAEAARFRPHDAGLRRAAEHGFDCLCGMLWDREHGGWFHRLDRAGRALEGYTKHTHGIAYAIQACVAVHELGGSGQPLALARDGFEWLDMHAHDERHGGYHSFLSQDGTVIFSDLDGLWQGEVDTIGAPLGLKDVNVHSDLLEALACLYRSTRDLVVGARVEELIDILTGKMMTGARGLHYFCERDWTPVPHVERFGNTLQTASRLLLTGELLNDDVRLPDTACRLLGHVLRTAWDPESGGVWYAGPGSPPTQVEGHDLLVRRKAWWPQWDLLKALWVTSGRGSDAPDHGPWIGATWAFLQEHFIDHEHGGVYREAAGGPALPAPAMQDAAAAGSPRCKGSDWKDASHDGRALLACLERPAEADDE